MARSLLRNSVIYSLGTILNRATGFLLIPVYTHWLSVAEYGMMSLLVMILQIASFVCLLGVSTAAMRYHFEPDADEDYRRKVYGNAMTLLLVLAPAILLVIGLASYPIAMHLLPSIPFTPYILIVLCTALFSPYTMLLLGLMRVRHQAVAFVSFNGGFFLFQALTTIAAMVWLHMGLVGQLYAQLASYFLFGLIAILMLLRYTRPMLSPPLPRQLLSLGLPLLPFFVAAWLGTALPRFLLERHTGLAEVGLFTLAMQFGGLVIMFATALDNALMPHFFEIAQRPYPAKELGAIILKYLSVLGLISVAALAIAKPAIVWMAAPAYQDTVRYVAPMALVSWLMVFCNPIQWSLTHTKHTGILSLFRGSGILMMVGLSWLFLGELNLGISGIVYAMLLTNIVSLVAGYLITQRTLPVSIPVRQFLIVTFTLIGGGTALAVIGQNLSLPLAMAIELPLLATITTIVLMASGIGSPLRLLDARRW